MAELFNASVILGFIRACYYVSIIYLCYIYTRKITTQQHVPLMSDIVNRDISYLGCYDDKLKYSTTTWLYSILVVCYLKDPSTDVKSIFLVWNDTFNYDPDGIVYGSIEDAWTRFLAVLDKSREFKQDPEFKISEYFDYHNLPKTLMYTDYVNTGELIKAIDILMEGGN